MQSLLRWSIENSNGANGAQNPPAQPRKDLDPAIIDQILGKPDAVLMKEALAIAVDENKDEDERIQALDDFEMLVEQIDNANDLEKLKMWEPLQNLLTSPSSAEGIKRQVLWIVGTAVQNNPSAQISYLNLSPLPNLLFFLSPSVTSAKTRSKAVYALSSLLKHNAAAVKQLHDAEGWPALKASLEDSDITVRRKAAFLFNALLIPTNPIAPQPPSISSNSQLSDERAVVVHPTAPQPQPNETTVHPNSHASMMSDPNFYSTSPITQRALEDHGILGALVQSLVSPVPYGPDGESEGDADFEEKVINVLHTYLTSCQGKLPGDQRQTLSRFLQEQNAKSGGDGPLAEKWGMSVSDVKSLQKAVQ